MKPTFSQVAHDVAGKHLPEPTVQRALEQLGPRAGQAVEALDTEHRIHLITHFVRALRNVGVHEATRIEHALVRALGASHTGRRPMAIKDAISLIAVRNHVHQLTTAAGMPWNAGMAVQSAVSEVARFVAANGGGEIECEIALDGRLHFEVRAHRGLGAVALGPGLPTPPWLIGVAKLADGFHAASDGGTTRIEFSIATSGAMVA